ncbi:DEAD-box type RNA helicase, partial [Coemansia helicoidea]
AGGARRLLVCAPSNAAVDEIVRRLMEGIRDGTGTTFRPRVVRVGQLSSVSSTVREATLEAQLDVALDKQRASAVKAKSGNALQALRKELDSVNAEIRELDNQLQSTDPVDMAALQAIRERFRSAKGRKRTVCQQLELERSRTRDEARAADEARTRLRRQILLGADVVCTTLSGSGHEALLSLECEYHTVIIDEAAQSVELACLIPLKYGCKRCILVGDPNQLPPTVLSRAAERCGYNQSLFVRVQRSAPAAVSLLSIQYRMHPEISSLPSRLFYNSLLRDGDGMAEARRAPWHASAHYPPLAFFNLAAGKEQRGAAHSVFNAHE